MSAVKVEIADAPPSEGPEPEPRESRADSPDSSSPPPSSPPPSDPEVEREITKRELIRSVANILVVVLYMVFTLLRDRDAGVVVIDPDDSDDWDE